MTRKRQDDDWLAGPSLTPSALSLFHLSHSARLLRSYCVVKWAMLRGEMAEIASHIAINELQAVLVWRTVSVVLFRQVARFAHLFACPDHAIDAENNERNAEELAHVEEHARLEAYLNVFGVLDEEAEGEDERDAEAEIEAFAHGNLPAAIAIPAHKEEQGVGQGLVKLAGMARIFVYFLKDKGPWNIGHFADNLAVHQVSEPNEAGCDGRGDGDIVQQLPQFHLIFTAIEPQGDHQAERSAVACQTFVAHEMPRTVGQKLEGNEHLEEMCARRKIVIGLVEEAMSESGSYQYAQEAIDKERVEHVFFLLFPIHHHRPHGDVLMVEQPTYHEIGTDKSDEPAYRIPANAPVAYLKEIDVGVPNDEVQHKHNKNTIPPNGSRPLRPTPTLPKGGSEACKGYSRKFIGSGT